MNKGAPETAVATICESPAFMGLSVGSTYVGGGIDSGCRSTARPDGEILDHRPLRSRALKTLRVSWPGMKTVDPSIEIAKRHTEKYLP